MDYFRCICVQKCHNGSPYICVPSHGSLFCNLFSNLPRRIFLPQILFSCNKCFTVTPVDLQQRVLFIWHQSVVSKTYLPVRPVYLYQQIFSCNTSLFLANSIFMWQHFVSSNKYFPETSLSLTKSILFWHQLISCNKYKCQLITPVYRW